ncbi:uncharacterized protein [Spinacia oleracea]|uniref:Reverse transcriptase zinc-binding domain-containing protein n=1 Tax=Spinacia oleracea TaxID=3562 RepID=A0ABM3R3B4_SPIOL|nr:uncharacterized protein LOC110795383 [Spinacia oleracea]
MGTLFIRDTRNFEHLLDFTDPVEVKSSGYYFSWSNKEEGYRRIESRIDRCFGNASWNNQYTTDLVEYMTLGLSDHSPLVIRSEGQSMLKLWGKLKHVKSGLKHLHNKEFVKLHERIEHLRGELENTQEALVGSSTDLTLQGKEKDLIASLRKFIGIQESAYKQKARIQWLKPGDSNNKFFFTTMKERHRRNNINILYDATGNRLTTASDIAREIRQFYTSLVGTAASSLQGVDLNIEIDDTLSGIDVSKAPGLDGLNNCFFKKAWKVIKEDVYKAVMEFFTYGKLLRQIIAKILTSRMQPIVGSIISDSQTVFIPGRPIIDNILLAFELIKGYHRKYISPRCMIKTDLRKAYDSLEWPFLKTMLHELGLPSRFVNWIFVMPKEGYERNSQYLQNFSVDGRRHRELPTKDRLISWNIAIDGTCSLCNQATESAAHLFFSCDFASNIWDAAL